MTTLICSIIIPVFNGDEPLVRAAIDSAAACLDLGCELIVVDSGSEQPVKQNWMPLNPRARLVVFADNLGLFANWNRALRLSHGQFVWALCADDRVVPETLWACIKLMKADESTSLISTYGTLRNLREETLGSIGQSFGPGVYRGPAAGKLFLEFYGKTWINPFNYPSGVMMRRSALEAVGYFDESMRHIGDIDLYFRMLGFGNLLILDRIGCLVTIHKGQTGQSIGKTPYGMIELQVMLDNLNYLSLVEKRRESRRLCGLALFAVLHYLLLGDLKSARTYLFFTLSHNPIAATFSLPSIILAKLLLKFQVGQAHWKSRLDELKI